MEAILHIVTTGCQCGQLQDSLTKPEIALEEIDRVIAADVRFGCVLAGAGYGLSASFRQALTSRGLCRAVGITRHQKVYPANVLTDLPGCRPWPSTDAARSGCHVRVGTHHARKGKVAEGQLA